jgi:hypothetical protein
MSEAWKYFAYKEGNNWRVNDLLQVSQIHAMLRTLAWQHEVFASIQTYDENGNIVGGPLWFDFDGQPDVVLSQTRHFVAACEFVVNVTPRIYFSGSKGFHLIIERFLSHPRVHELVANFASEIGGGLTTLDPKVFRTRSMFRIPGSKASKPGYYKIEITRSELFDLSYDAIRNIAASQRCIETEHDPSTIDEDVLESWLGIAKLSLPKYDTMEKVEALARSVELEVTPCISHMLRGPVPQGERNMTVYTLAKFFRGCEIDEATVRDILLAQPHYASFEAEGREVSKVLRSVYRSRQPQLIGCRGTSGYAETMRSMCDQPCPFRPDFNHRPYTDAKGSFDAEEPAPRVEQPAAAPDHPTQTYIFE